MVIGPLYDYGHLQSLLRIGSFLSVLWMMLTSISTQCWHLLLCQGVLLGVGNGCLFIPSIAILPTYFSKKQTLVLGISSSGATLGIHLVLFPPCFFFRWTKERKLTEWQEESFSPSCSTSAWIWLNNSRHWIYYVSTLFLACLRNENVSPSLHRKASIWISSVEGAAFLSLRRLPFLGLLWHKHPKFLHSAI